MSDVASILPVLYRTGIQSEPGAATVPQITSGGPLAHMLADVLPLFSFPVVGWDYRRDIEEATAARYREIFARLTALHDCDDADDQIELGAIRTASLFASRLLKADYPAPQLSWHGGDAIVFWWDVGDNSFLFTVVDGAIGYSERHGDRIARRSPMLDPEADWSAFAG